MCWASDQVQPTELREIQLLSDRPDEWTALVCDSWFDFSADFKVIFGGKKILKKVKSEEIYKKFFIYPFHKLLNGFFKSDIFLKI